MELYQRIALETFVKGWEPGGGNGWLTIPAVHLMYAVPSREIDYGLSLLRRAIGTYEEKKGILPGASKREMPFFRENRRMLVGPEVELYTVLFYGDKGTVEKAGAAAWSATGFSSPSEGPALILTFDSDTLLRHCLLENRFLIGCKYDPDQVSATFEAQLEKEYDKFFYDAEHTGFAADSRFFSLLCNACLEVKEACFAAQQEWRMALLCGPEEADYRYVAGKLIPYVPVSVPKDSLVEIELPGYREDPLAYGALAGFLRKVGLPPERYLKGIREG